MAIKSGDYAAAVNYFGQCNCVNAALANVLAGNNNEALKKLNAENKDDLCEDWGASKADIISMLEQAKLAGKHSEFYTLAECTSLDKEHVRVDIIRFYKKSHEKEIAEIRSNLPKAAASTADKGHVIVLKDARTIVSDGSVPSYINMSGNNGMATGGSGDVLTGIICGFLAGGLDILTAARLGVYCHGLAGDAAAKEKGYYSVLAGDLPNYLETILKQKHFPEEI